MGLHNVGPHESELARVGSIQVAVDVPSSLEGPVVVDEAEQWLVPCILCKPKS